MKKKKISGLSLNKKTISKLNSSKVTGGVKGTNIIIADTELGFCIGQQSVTPDCIGQTIDLNNSACGASIIKCY